MTFRRGQFAVGSNASLSIWTVERLFGKFGRPASSDTCTLLLRERTQDR
jgi:hypothetical protein